MKLFAIRRTAAVALALAATLGGCSLLPAARTGSTAGSGATTPPKVDAATVLSSPAPLVRSAGGQNNHPPDGLLSSGGADVAGKLGSYCYGNTCADIAQWPPKANLPELVAANDLHFELANAETFVGWQAGFGPKSNGSAEILGEGGESFDPDTTGSPAESFTSASFKAPPVGDWVVWLFVDLESGDLSYAWHVTVLPDTATE